jgi:hypothetical protein
MEMLHEYETATRTLEELTDKKAVLARIAEELERSVSIPELVKRSDRSTLFSLPSLFSKDFIVMYICIYVCICIELRSFCAPRRPWISRGNM